MRTAVVAVIVAGVAIFVWRLRPISTVFDPQQLRTFEP